MINLRQFYGFSKNLYLLVSGWFFFSYFSFLCSLIVCQETRLTYLLLFWTRFWAFCFLYFTWVILVVLASLPGYIFSRQHNKIAIVHVNDKASQGFLILKIILFYRWFAAFCSCKQKVNTAILASRTHNEIIASGDIWKSRFLEMNSWIQGTVHLSSEDVITFHCRFMYCSIFFTSSS